MSLIRKQPKNLGERAVIEEFSKLEAELGPIEPFFLEEQHSVFIGIYVKEGSRYPLLINTLVNKNSRWKKVFANFLLDSIEMHRSVPNPVKPVIICVDKNPSGQIKAEKVAKTIHELNIPFISDVYILTVKLALLYKRARFKGDYTVQETKEYFELERFPKSRKEHMRFIMDLLKKPRTLNELLKLIPKEAELNQQDVERYLDRLKKDVMVFEPKPGEFQSV